MSELEKGAGHLEAADLGADPLQACAGWLEDASVRSKVSFANAVCLSTVSANGWPQGRMVLVKSVDRRGVSFFTNYESSKGRALADVPRAAITFYWYDLERQIRLKGGVTRLSAEESDAYFRTRPRGSQVGAWASEQSVVLDGRGTLEQRHREIEARFSGSEVPRPTHWGGYLLAPVEIEFWQGREDRLHDRIAFRRDEAGTEGLWLAERLNP